VTIVTVLAVSLGVKGAGELFLSQLREKQIRTKNNGRQAAGNTF
jgi:hypothetical protein